MDKKKLLLFLIIFFVQVGAFSQILDASSYANSSQALLSSSLLSSSLNSLKTDVASQNSLKASEFTTLVQVAMSNADYMVTAGDVYSLTYAANNTPISYTIAVDSTYRVRVSNLAVLDANGKSYLTLKKQVEEIVQKNYPLSGVQFVLLTPATYKVVVKGEVLETTEQTVWALTRLSDVIKDLTTDLSSFRNVNITSSNNQTKTYDLFKAARDGDLSQNPYVRPGDVITVKKANRQVFIEGSVNRPGTYELLPGENLRELIDYYAGGFTYYADRSRLELCRQDLESDNAGKKQYLTEQNYKDNFGLVSFDKITVFDSNDLRPVVFVEGAVNFIREIQGSLGITYSAQQTTNSVSSSLNANNKLAMRFNEGEDYAFFVRRNKNIFTNVSDLDNAYIIRGTEHIPVNLTKMIYDSSYKSQIPMQYNDTLLVPFKQFFVSVSGAVYAPGRYPYIPDRTWDYYIGLAGGFVKDKNRNNAIKITDSSGNVHSKGDYILPEMTIEAEYNNGLYYFNQYAPVITTILSMISTTVTIILYVNNMSK